MTVFSWFALFKSIFVSVQLWGDCQRKNRTCFEPVTDIPERSCFSYIVQTLVAAQDTCALWERTHAGTLEHWVPQIDPIAQGPIIGSKYIDMYAT